LSSYTWSNVNRIKHHLNFDKDGFKSKNFTITFCILLNNDDNNNNNNISFIFSQINIDKRSWLKKNKFLFLDDNIGHCCYFEHFLIINIWRASALWFSKINSTIKLFYYMIYRRLSHENHSCCKKVHNLYTVLDLDN
jgi:hypothetical protein